MYHNRKEGRGKAYLFMLRSYILMMLVALGISVLGYVYSYWTIRQDIKLNYSALLNQEKLMLDREWYQVSSNIGSVATNSIVRQLAVQENWTVPDLFDAVDLITELQAFLKENVSAESFGVYFYNNKSFVTNKARYASRINYIYLLEYGLTVDEFTAQMKGLSGYYVFSKGNEKYLVFYHNIFDNSYKKVTASSFAVLPWNSVRRSFDTMINSEDSGSYLVNSDQLLIGNTNPKVDITGNGDIYLAEDHVLYDRRMKGKNYIISAVTSDLWDIQYVIYAPKSKFFENMNRLGYIIAFEMIAFLLLGGYIAVYFSKKNSIPVERLLSLLKVRKTESKDASFAQLYQNLENSLRSLITGHENLYHKLNNIDLVVEKYVFTNLMRGWNPDDGWMEEYLNRIKEKYHLSNYRVVLFSFNNLEDSLFTKEQNGSHAIDYPIVLFSIENVINELILKYDYNGAVSCRGDKGIIIEMGDMTACIVNFSQNLGEEILQESVQHCIDFFRSAFRIDAYASISGIHRDYEELEIAYEEAVMTMMHKSFWGNSLMDVVLFDHKRAGYDESDKKNKLVFQAKKLTNCLMLKDYDGASEILDETLENCFSRDVNKLSYNQYQAATLIFIILGNLSEMVPREESIVAQDNWTSSDRILSMSSLKDIKVNLHAILDEIAMKYEASVPITEEPEWLAKVEEYIVQRYSDSEINISAISEKFGISMQHVGRTFKKYRGINMLDYIHHLRINKSKELMEKGKSVTECAKEVGYVDAKSFIRAFKRYEGITPGQYKSV